MPQCFILRETTLRALGNIASKLPQNSPLTWSSDPLHFVCLNMHFALQLKVSMTHLLCAYKLGWEPGRGFPILNMI